MNDFSTLTSQQISNMTSDEYRQHFDGPDGDSFRKRVAELDSQPKHPTRKAGNVRPDAEQSVQPASTGFDPSFDSFDDEEQVAASAPAPVAVAEPVAEGEEKIYEYQPVSKITGKAVGGLQRFKYRTKDELIEKLAAAHSAASSRIRELSRNKKLEELISSGPTEKNFTPSTEVPKTMEELAKELLEQRQQNFLLSVREALNAFQLSADWTKYRSKANAESVVLAVERLGLSPADPASYHTAFQHMKDVLEPVVEPAPTSAPAPAPAVAATPAPALRTAPSAGIATGFSNADSTSDDLFVEPTKVVGVKIVMPDGKTQVMTLAAYDRLGTDVQKRILRNGSNQAAIEALTIADDQAKAARRGGR